MIPSQLPIMALATRPGALQALALQPGQMLEGKVLGTMPNGTTQLQVGQQTLSVALPMAMAPGTSVQLQVQGSGAQQKLVLLPTAQGSTQPMPVSTPTSIPQGAPPPSPPQVALAQMLHAAVPQQQSLASLTTTLSAVVGKLALPQPVLQAAQQILNASLPLSGPSLTGASLQQAIATSGIFQEAVLARGMPELARADLKTALLTLRGALTTWLGQAATATRVAAPLHPLPPPVRGAPPRARPMVAEPIPETPELAGMVLLERTEGSLARLRLHQHASLPDPAAGPRADWSMDIPVLIGSYQTVMQLQIHRDEAGSSEAPAERGWQLRFAMDVPSLGEVGAQVGLRGGTISVRLWASDPATAAQMQQAAPQLNQALLAAGLKPGMVVVRNDDPAPNPPAAGHFLDSRT